MSFLAMSLLWAVLVGAISQHQRSSGTFKGSSAGLLLAMQASMLVGSISMVGLLGWAIWQTSPWYQALLAFVCGMFAGALAMGALERVVGTLALNLVSFAWPVAAVFLYSAIRQAS